MDSSVSIDNSVRYCYLKVEYSVLQFSEVGGRLILTLDRYLSPMCMGFVSGSSDWGSRSCVLATSYASGGKYFVVGAEK